MNVVERIKYISTWINDYANNNSKNPFDFMALQDVQELTNFFEKTVPAYQVGVEGEVEFSDDF